MSDFMPSNESPALAGRPAGKVASASWGVATGMDQITVVRIDDTHIAEERAHAGGRAKEAYYDMDYSMPEEEEEEKEEEDEEDEEDGVYVIEYSNPEEEGESYQFTMSVDRSLPALKRPTAPERPAAPAKPPRRPRQKRKRVAEEEDDEEEEEEKRPLVSNMCLLEPGPAAASPAAPPGRARLLCSLCPPPGRTFKRASGLAVHLKHLHHLQGNKSFFCPGCRRPLRSQAELDAHTKRHAHRGAAFICTLCPAPAPSYRGSRIGLKGHLTREHAGVVPRCHVCLKDFGSLASYLNDQFRHVGVSPFFCGRCRVYEMTERGLDVHVRNHGRKERRREEKRERKEEEERERKEEEERERKEEEEEEREKKEEEEKREEEEEKWERKMTSEREEERKEREEEKRKREEEEKKKREEEKRERKMTSEREEEEKRERKEEMEKERKMTREREEEEEEKREEGEEEKREEEEELPQVSGGSRPLPLQVAPAKSPPDDSDF